MTMQCRHLDPAVAQRLEYGIDLPCDEHEVTGDRCLTAASRLEVDDNARTHGDRNRHSALHYGFGPGDVELIDTAIDCTLGAKRLIDCGGVQVERRRSEEHTSELQSQF